MPLRHYWVIGVMSGTSLDGLDIAYCEFWQTKKWHYRIHYAQTVSYSLAWKQKLSQAHLLESYAFIELHKDYGIFIGEEINRFIRHFNISRIDLIASHGHTIFHQPNKGINFQVGNGAFIAARTGITTIYDFRTLDIAFGGQGAPLVPLGDELLFPDYDYCLNIGGISNISFQHNHQRIAFDICPSNFVLNFLAQKKGYDFDKAGQLARLGQIDNELFHKLNCLPYYKISYPKSLGREWIEQEFLPIIENSCISTENKLATCVEHIAYQIGRYTQKQGKMIITGGGAHNSFLIERIKANTRSEVIIPDALTIDFKEALIFAFLGLLRYLRKPTALSSVTGSQIDSISGICAIIEKATLR
ncbi:MAG: anhydro-N-acetylmuramic acid kinase [Bacteroidales bacterium]|nr:anhydro-N-acetylmuramic acid kinase [Bacteroidales bacterium]